MDQNRTARPGPLPGTAMAPLLTVALTVAIMGTLFGPLAARAGASGTPLATWNLAQDFLASATSGSPTNPFGDSYGNPDTWQVLGSTGLAHDPSTYYLLTAFNFNTCGDPGFAGWTSPTAGGWVNTTSMTLGCVNQVLPTHQAFEHPGPANLALYGWKSPISGTVDVSGRMADADCGGGNGVAWYIDQGSTDIASGSFPNCGTQSFPSGLSVTVSSGDFLYFIVDPNGEYSYDQTEVDVTIDQVDVTPPTINGSAAPAANANGWNNSAVTVSFTCSDSESGVASCPSSTVLSAEGGNQSVTGTATDNAGNSASATIGPINIDLTAPSIALTAPADNASYTIGQVVAAAYSCSDSLSGIDSCIGTVPSGSAIDTATPGTKSFAVTATDLAGNITTASATYSVVASQATTTTVTSSANPSVLNTAVTFTATVSAATGTPSGSVQWQIDGVNSGSPVALSAYGKATLVTSTLTLTNATAHTISASYLGAPGFNPSSGSLGQFVKYASTGNVLGSPGHQILQPVNADGTSVFKAGSTVVAKFRVGDANGVSIGSPGVVTSFRLTETIGGTVVNYVDEAVNSSTPDTAFRWDPTAQQWIYNISTKGMATGFTYMYTITLNDGSTIVFQFGLR